MDHADRQQHDYAHRRIGVVSNGSSISCSRPPATEYAARVLGMMTGIKSR
jgi:hypothetical protein